MTHLERAKELGVITHIHPKDSMHAGSDEQYFAVGESGLQAVEWGLTLANKPERTVNQILDFASGYGRVSRWLKARFPARLYAVDADERAVAALHEIIGADVQPADLKMHRCLGGPFDIIWMGSLITHLQEADTVAVLKYLHSHLAGDGVFVGTMHGPLVADRIRTRAKTYGLKEPEIERLVADYDAIGYGFGAYHHDPNYGISAAKIERMRQLLADSGFAVLGYEEKKWASHQDVFAVSKA